LMRWFGPQSRSGTRPRNLKFCIAQLPPPFVYRVVEVDSRRAFPE
jgi:hypothetical protein